MKAFALLPVALVVAAASGCATYHGLPLATGRGPQRIADITVSPSSMPVPVLHTYRFDPANGLDVTEVAMLAVANNPQLRVQRDKAGIARAQAYAAGLLPDPSVSYQHARPVGGPPDSTDSFTAGLSLDLGNLVTRSARKASARAGERKVNLKLLWDEWQTIARARILFDHIYYTRKLLARLDQEHAALEPLQTAIIRALQARDLTYSKASAGLNAMTSVSTQIGDAESRLYSAERDLHDLLGLDASVPLHLTGAPFSVHPSRTEVQYALTEMPRRRPDLLALRAGYQSQQAKLRAAILAQFPAITVGFLRARDNSNLSSRGFAISLSLPLFNGNRGNIAIARATRQQLHDAYSARLLVDRNDVQRLYADLQSDRRQRATVIAHAAQLASARNTARTNYASGRLAWPTYLAIRTNSLAADTTLLRLKQSTHQSAVALDALVGNWPAPSVAPAAQESVHQ